MKFSEFAEQRGIKLHGWQKDAAEAYLRQMYKVREFPSGKTFLTKLLDEFLSEHGNNFDIEPL